MSRVSVALQPFIRSINPDFTFLRGTVGVTASAQPTTRKIIVSSVSQHNVSSTPRLDEHTPLFQVTPPSDSRLSEMQSMMADPRRLPLFRILAKEENFETSLELVLSLMKYKRECELLRGHFSGSTSEKLREAAKALLASLLNNSVKSSGAAKDNKKIRGKSLSLLASSAQEEDISIPLVLAAQIEKDIDQWSAENDNVIISRTILFKDFIKNSSIFDNIIREISISLYQKLWVRFRVVETEELANDGQSTSQIRHASINMQGIVVI